MTSAVSSWPTSYPLASSSRSSTRCRPGSTPAAVKWPCSGLLSVRRPSDPPGHLQGGVALALGRLHLDHPHGRDLAAPSPGWRGSARPRPGSCRPSRRRSPWSPRWMGPFRPHAGAAATSRHAWFGSSAPSPAPGSHANAPPGKPERSARQVLPRGPYLECRQALGDVDSAYWAEIGPTCDVTPWVQGPARRISPSERAGGPGPPGEEYACTSPDLPLPIRTLPRVVIYHTDAAFVSIHRVAPVAPTALIPQSGRFTLTVFPSLSPNLI